MSETVIHESAIIDDDVEIGEGSRIWHFCHLSPGARLGRDCVLGQNVYLGPGVRIGNGVKIQNNVSVYEGVELEDDVFCGPSLVFTNVRTPRSFVNRKDAFGQTLVRRGASLGANATVVCGVTVGAYAMVAAGAVITADVPAHALVLGVPGRIVGWVSRSGMRLDLPAAGEACASCPETGDSYRLEGETLYLEAPE